MRLSNKLFIAVALALFVSCNPSPNGSKETKDYSLEPTIIVIKAAKGGDVNALVELVNRYADGESELFQDYAAAFEWCTKAAEKGDAAGQYALAVCYEEGIGTVQNSKEAVRWYLKAAEQGYVDAQYHLGYCYEKGRGVKQDDKEAIRWYTKAAEQGNIVAQERLDVCNNKGKLIDANPNNTIPSDSLQSQETTFNWEDFIKLKNDSIN